MLEFFRGWRRKAGCVTLVMACAVAGMWMRSFTIFEGFWALGPRGNHGIFSVDGTLRWWTIDFTYRMKPRWYSTRIAGSREILDPWSDGQMEWQRRYAGFVIGSGYTEALGEPVAKRLWIIPYWPLVLSLTLLSAYLLLWQPRKRTEPKHA